MRATIKLKLGAAFAAVLIVCGVLGIVGVLKMSSINQQSTVISENWMPSIDAVHPLNTATGTFVSYNTPMLHRSTMPA
ncbi:hypothetical protein BH10PSE15_BH10PSE15_02580 [soil metagenome]